MGDTSLLLDLTRSEEGTLKALGPSKFLSVSEIARRAVLPRMTVRACLERLQTRGLVSHETTAYRSLWKIVDQEKLRQKMWEGLSFLESGLEARILSDEGIPTQQNTEVSTFRGLELVLKLYFWFLINNHGKRVFSIQPNLLSKAVAQKLGSEKMAQIKAYIEQNRVSVAAIVPEGIEDTYRSIASDKELLQAFFGCTSTMYLISPSLLTFNADLLMGSKMGIFVNWAEETALLLRDLELVKMQENLYNLLFKMAKPFDQRAFVSTLIEQQQKTL